MFANPLDVLTSVFHVSGCQYSWDSAFLIRSIRQRSPRLDKVVSGQASEGVQKRIPGQRDFGSFNMASPLRTFSWIDISSPFHHSTGIPIAQNVQNMMALGTLDLPNLAELQQANDNVKAFLKTFCDGLREQRIERQKFEEKLKTVESQLSDASREQDEVKRLLEEFAAYTLANTKAEELVRAVLDDLEAWMTLKERTEAARASSASEDTTAEGKAVEKKNRLGRTELHNAVCSGDKDYVQQLLENRASVDATDRSGRTPLHLAASEVSEPAKIIELLLEARARTEAEDLSGFTPLNLACDTKCKEAVAVLQSAEGLSKVAGKTEHQIGTEAPLDVLHFLPKHMPAVASDANEITFEGNIMPGAQQCWTSFPGKFKAGWDALVSVPAFGDSVACVFLCDSQSGLGEHKKDPKGDGKKCYCYRIYGERRDEEYKKFGYVIYVRKKYSECSDLERSKLEQKANTMDAELVFEDDDSSAREAKEKRARERFAQKKTAAFGCSWYDLWFQRVREAVQQGQRLKVVFFPGEAMEGRVDMDALATADLWNGVGLGTSQKCEVATLEAQAEKVVNR
eukprot:s5223_g3.t1